ncbi:MAG: PQQ-dependent sugar dehydrogenase [Hyphomonadaceae bacterium]|nr:PQQ-dependent sugar dehydrogenase [Hyphomonadaceae bacterium]
MLRRTFLAGMAAPILGCAPGRAGAEAAAQAPALAVDQLATGLAAPWGLAFLPDGAALITEKVGGVRLMRDGAVEEGAVMGGPSRVRADGQAGLHDIALDPRFAENGFVYISFFEDAGPRGRLALYRARFDGRALRDGAVIYRASQRSGTNHPGGRMCFLPDETLLLFVGLPDNERDAAQDLRSTLGKVLRLTRDGAAAPGNPFAGRADAAPEIYSYGHRNAMGLAYDRETNIVWLHENGPRGGDELNIIRAGANYGWPRVTYGREYSGAEITSIRTAPGVDAPVTQWTPSLAPSGLCVYRGAMFPHWRGDLLIGMLAGSRIERVRVAGGAVTEREDLLADRGERIRDVREGPDGALYVLTDGGALLRVRAA